MLMRARQMMLALLPLALVLTAMGGQAWWEQPDPEPVRIRGFAPKISSSLEQLAQHASEWEELRVEALTSGHRRYTQLVRAEQLKRLAADPRPVLVETILGYNPALSDSTARELAGAIVGSGKRHGVDPFLIAALISKESRFRPGAVSPGGAVGLGQLLPGTARELGVDCWSPAGNIEGCSKYLGRQMRRWKGRTDAVKLALASYNAGPGAVIRYGGVPPYPITRDYVRVISSRYQSLQTRAQERAEALARRSVIDG